MCHSPPLLSLGRATRAKGTKDTCFPENVPDDRGLKWTVLEKKRHTDRLQMSSSAAQLHLLLVLLKALAPWQDEHTHLAGFYYSAINKAHQLFGWAGLQLASVYSWSQLLMATLCSIICSFFFFSSKQKWCRKKILGVGGREWCLRIYCSTCPSPPSSEGKQHKQRGTLALFLGLCILQNLAPCQPLGPSSMLYSVVPAKLRFENLTSCYIFFDLLTSSASSAGH